MKFKGLLLKESLNNTDVLESLNITKEERWDVGNATDDQPNQWTALYFEGDVRDAKRVADELAASLKEGKWYTNFDAEGQEYIIFPGKVFQYEKGNTKGVERAKEYGRSIGIPEDQLDWNK